MPKVWLAAREAQRVATNTCIIDFELKTPDELDLPSYLRGLEDVEYSSASYTRIDEKNVSLLDHHASKPGLDPRLVKADLLALSCTRAVFTVWDILHRILSSDLDLKFIRWMRSNPYPGFITFAADGKIVASNHDYVLITYHAKFRC